MRVSLEFKKSILMIILLLLCVFQMGILWSDKSPGIPFPFSTQTFQSKTETVNIDEVKSLYIRPEKMIVSDGTGFSDGNGYYWPLSSGNESYKAIWADFTASYLKQIVENRPKTENVYNADWDAIMKMKCIIIELPQKIPVGIFEWMTGTDKPVILPFKEIHKIAIFPSSEDINNDKLSLYVTNDGKTVYTYVVTIPQGGMKKEDYIQLIEGIENDNSIIPLRLVGTWHSVVNDDLMAVLMDPDEKEEKIIWDLLVKTPDKIALQKDNIDTIQEVLLESASSLTVPSDDGTYVSFSDDEKIVKYYQNGFLDYRYRQLSGAKGTVEEALEKAVAFIELRRKNIFHEIDISLKEIDSKTSENYYIFKFNYVLDDMDIKVLDEEGKTVTPAITISANRDRVLDVKWYIKSFSYNDYFNYYNLNFYNFYENQFYAEYPQFAGKLKDISIDYLYTVNGMRAEPYWLIETDQEKIVYCKMQGERE